VGTHLLPLYSATVVSRVLGMIGNGPKHGEPPLSSLFVVHQFHKRFVVTSLHPGEGERLAVR
jgi:hypothetical protein